MRLDPRHYRAAELIARGFTYEKAGADKDVAVEWRTVARWMVEPEFRSIVDSAKRESVSRAIATIGGNLEPVARTMLGIATGGIKADARTRFDAAKWILEHSGALDEWEAEATTEQHLHLELPAGSTISDIRRLRDELAELIEARSSAGGT